MASLKIGILGSRGIPNHYGGYEQFAQFLSAGLVGRGHRVWVYQSALHPYKQPAWQGIGLIRKRDPENRLGSFGQFVYDFSCLTDARRRDFDILLQLGYTSNAVFYPLWPKSCVNIIHMDGLEWKRTKYRPPVRRFLRRMERRAATHGDVLIADSLIIQKYLNDTYRREALFIPYGAEIPKSFEPGDLGQYALKPYEYHLAIARFVPENNLEMIIGGYLSGRRSHPLILVGNHHNSFGRYLQKKFSHPSVRYLGGIYDKATLNNLRHHCRLYFHGHSVGGTNPSLLEAMAGQALICAHKNAFNESVLGADAYFFERSSDVGVLTDLVIDEGRRRSCISVQLQKIRRQYSWEKIIDQYEACFFECLQKT